jgi:hypothetical protein
LAFCVFAGEMSSFKRIVLCLPVVMLVCGGASAFAPSQHLPLRFSQAMGSSRFLSKTKPLRLSGGSGFADVSMTGASHNNSPIEDEVLKDHAELKQYYDHYKTSGDMKWYFLQTKDHLCAFAFPHDDIILLQTYQYSATHPRWPWKSSLMCFCKSR